MADDDISFARITEFLAQHARIYAISGLVGLLSFATWALLKPRQFTAVAAFVPQTRTMPSGLTQLAAQFGFGNIGNAETGRSPAFYADLLRTDPILQGIVEAPVATLGMPGDARTLADVLKAKGKTVAERSEDGVKRLRNKANVTPNAKTGVVSVTVKLPNAGLSAGVANRMLAAIDSFNLQSRRTQASAERRFAQQRVAEMRQELSEAETRLEQFLLRNRNFRASPELTLVHDRLERDVNLKQQVFTTLSQAFEQARIEEVRDTPAITRVQTATPPASPDRRGTLRFATLGLFLGFVGATFVAFGMPARILKVFHARRLAA